MEQKITSRKDPNTSRNFVYNQGIFQISKEKTDDSINGAETTTQPPEKNNCQDYIPTIHENNAKIRDVIFLKKSQNTKFKNEEVSL